MNLKKSLGTILNRKNYKYIIIILIVIICLFMMCGNYNLVEGLSLKEKTKELNRNLFEAKDIKNGAKSDADKHSMKANANKDGLKEDLKTLTEGMNNCSSNHSNLGVGGNRANEIVHSQCSGLNNLQSANESVMNQEFNE
mgnify:CR=1 FL=1|tara:strand:+ start:238 stop:657 length:420 start_codon:yes stop_codon:yes gene_type:complete